MSLRFPALIASALVFSGQALAKCRNTPGSAGWPDEASWRALNTTVGGRLVPVVPLPEYCKTLPGGECTDDQWTSGLFRSQIPGAIDQDNWAQGYDLSPPSLCFRNSSSCGQGDLPFYAVEVETVADVQAAVKFASTHNLRLAVKSSGHDYLGRSTAPNSLLIHMAKVTNVDFTDNFLVDGKNLGSAVTVGPGVHLQDIYMQTKARGKIAIGGTAATVCAAGGYLQGAGHSALSPLLGLSADNVLEFQIVVADGTLLKANNAENADLFYALRGGGAGSWGVIVSATLSTFPTFNATVSLIQIQAPTNAAAAAIARVNAKHIFDFDVVRGGQYFYLRRQLNSSASLFQFETILPKITLDEGRDIIAPSLQDMLAVPGVSLVSEEMEEMLVNDVLYNADDNAGGNGVMGSRLIPAASYEGLEGPATVEKVYRELLDAGAPEILGHLVAGGQVSANANISSAITPAWRTAKTHLIVPAGWDDSASLDDIKQIRGAFQHTFLPILEQLSGPDAGAYSNEADTLEPNFQTTFFGPNYAKLTAIKKKYDAEDLFIVATGVGSERWDQWGMCTI
ncbi:FAD-binding domain-containing protein [Favolaschia claudopus]|uniref:FAD-binding domain-containing protein n=1 Tax=Favolaschia claudopus TaxID=2862362 RepID=A0AAW0E1B8_9AGAR